MSLYAIGDLHLSLDTNKPMDIFGGEWENHMEKLTEGFKELQDDDLCVLCGDTSWGMTLEESLRDFKYIESLPGQKIILKGNHDYWWNTAAKMKAFFAKNEIKSIEILHNNCHYYGKTALCGTRGWLYDEDMTFEENAKITAREVTRLRASLQVATSTAGNCEKLCFFHFPPRFGKTICHDLISVMDEFGVKSCLYGHLHGKGHRFAVIGTFEGIEYDIISADYVGFKPKRIK